MRHTSECVRTLPVRRRLRVQAATRQALCCCNCILCPLTAGLHSGQAAVRMLPIDPLPVPVQCPVACAGTCRKDASSPVYEFASIYRMGRDGSNVTLFARGRWLKRGIVVWLRVARCLRVSRRLLAAYLFVTLHAPVAQRTGSAVSAAPPLVPAPTAACSPHCLFPLLSVHAIVCVPASLRASLCLPPFMPACCPPHRLQACATRWVLTSTPPLATCTSQTTDGTVSCPADTCCVLPAACCLPLCFTDISRGSELPLIAPLHTGWSCLPRAAWRLRCTPTASALAPSSRARACWLR